MHPRAKYETLESLYKQATAHRRLALLLEMVIGAAEEKGGEIPDIPLIAWSNLMGKYEGELVDCATDRLKKGVKACKDSRSVTR